MFIFLMGNSTLQIHAKCFLWVWATAPSKSNKPSIRLPVTKDTFHQRDQSGNALGFFIFCRLDDFLAVIPINWWLNTKTKRRTKGRARAQEDEGQLYILSIKRFFFLICSHWRRRGGEIDSGRWKGGCEYLCSLSLSFSGSFFTLRLGTRLAAGEWLSWEKHQYPFIHTITHH